MLPSDHRLRRRQDFSTAVRRGRRSGRPTLVVHLYRGRLLSAAASDTVSSADGDPHAAGPMETPEVTPSPVRAGFVVSKAVGNAVVRNRVKRRLRHLVADRLAVLPAGSLIVVRALPPAGDADHDLLGHDLDAALHRLLRRPGAAAAPGTATTPGADGAGDQTGRTGAGR